VSVSASPFPPVELDRIADYPGYWAARVPEREAMVLGERRYSYRQLAEAVDALAKALLAAGVARGERIAMLSTPRPEALISFLAAARIGALWTGLNPRHKRDEYRYVIGDADPVVLLALPRIEERDYTPDLKALAGEHRCIRRVVTLGAAVPGLSIAYEDFLAEGRAVSDAAFAAAVAAVEGRDPVFLVYTSGSTGRPKGAMLTQWGLAHCSRNQCDHWFAEPLRVLNNMPISNAFCVGDLFCFALVGGGTTVFMERFDAHGILEATQRERLTLWGQVPTQFQMILSRPDFARYDLSSLQFIFWAGARAPRELIGRLQAITPKVSTSYGLTETVGSVTFTEVGANLDIMAETVGKPDPHYEMRVVAPDGRVLGDDEEGELQVRGAFLMPGYYRRPEATAAAIDAEGWLHTGDLGLRRADGNYRVSGRLAEMYKSGGYNIYPREIEMVIEQHSGVAMAAVIGVADPLYGEVGRAYVLRRPGAGLSESDLAAWCRERVANYKVPKVFAIRDRLPMLPVGKIDKQALKAEAGADSTDKG
jgi:acyl-CoA synthetase (AMP-forming)/AMP-acid ligase II